MRCTSLVLATLLLLWAGETNAQPSSSQLPWLRLSPLQVKAKDQGVPNRYNRNPYGTYDDTRPAQLPYREGQRIPRGYVLEERPRKGFVIAGSIVLTVGYMPALVAGLAGEDTSTKWLLAPVLGPWMNLATREEDCDDALECSGEAAIVSLLIMDGIIQTTGGILLAVGILVTKDVLVRSDMVEEAKTAPRPAFTISPVAIGSHGAGVMLRSNGF